MVFWRLQILGVFLLFFGCSLPKEDIKMDAFFDMESISSSRNFYCERYQSNQSGVQTDSIKFEGKFSCKVNSKNRIGVRFPLIDIKSGDLIKVSVWVHGKKGESRIVFTSPGSFYKFSESSYEEKSGWYKMELFSVVPNFIVPPVLIVTLMGDNEAFYDNLSLKVLERKPVNKIANIEHIKLSIGSKELIKLNKIKDAALSKKILISGKKDWIKSTVALGNNKHKAKLRLKGDWTDHLETDKLSYRVKIEGKGGEGNKTFSLQSPQTRGFLYEWVLKKLLEKEHIITPNYKFVYLSVNDEFKGVYVKEDHFTDEMLVHQNSEPSVILKFNEDLLWKIRRDYPDEYHYNISTYESAEILPFNKKETFDKRYNEFLEARGKLYKYQFEKENLSSVFDVEKLAKYVAIIDFTRSYHALIWHNKRFYYNKDSLLEPIGYDGFTEYNPYLWTNKPFVGAMKKGKLLNSGIRAELNNNEFRSRYLYYLSTYFNASYFDQFFIDISEELNDNLGVLQSEYPEFSYDKRFIYINDSIIKDELGKRKYESIYDASHWIDMKLRSRVTPISEMLYPVKNASVKCYIDEQVNGNYHYTVISFFSQPILVVGFVDSKEDVSEVSISLAAYSIRLEPVVWEQFAVEGYKSILYKTLTSDSIHEVKIIKLPAPFN
jgi:hypothetical protein